MQSSGSSLPSSPILSEGYGSGKRPLTEVKEEDQEKDEDYEMVSGFKQYDDIQGKFVVVAPVLTCKERSPRSLLMFNRRGLSTKPGASRMGP